MTKNDLWALLSRTGSLIHSWIHKKVEIHVLVSPISVVVERAATQSWHYTKLTRHRNREPESAIWSLEHIFSFAPDQSFTTSIYVCRIGESALLILKLFTSCILYQ